VLSKQIVVLSGPCRCPYSIPRPKISKLDRRKISGQTRIRERRLKAYLSTLHHHCRYIAVRRESQELATGIVTIRPLELTERGCKKRELVFLVKLLTNSGNSYPLISRDSNLRRG
jgi:hypothetical protein